MAVVEIMTGDHLSVNLRCHSIILAAESWKIAGKKSPSSDENFFFKPQKTNVRAKVEAVTSLPEHEVSRYSNLCFKQWTLITNVTETFQE